MKAIPLSDGLVAIVDDCDYEMTAAHSWTTTQGAGRKTFYARAIIDGRSVLMHQLILPPQEGFVTDHRNGEGLDNRRCNLRYATNSQNGANQRRNGNNTSRFKGVSWKKGRGWRARIRVDGEEIHLGHFESEIDAAKAYDAAAIRCFGTFASPNFQGLTQRVSPGA